MIVKIVDTISNLTSEAQALPLNELGSNKDTFGTNGNDEQNENNFEKLIY